jgi:hypothetical protein
MLAYFYQCADFRFNLDDSSARIVANVGVLFELLPEPVLHHPQVGRQWRVPLERLLPWSQDGTRVGEVHVEWILLKPRLRHVWWSTVALRRGAVCLLSRLRRHGLRRCSSLLVLLLVLLLVVLHLLLWPLLLLLLLTLLLLVLGRLARLSVVAVGAIEVGVAPCKCRPDRSVLSPFLTLRS